MKTKTISVILLMTMMCGAIYAEKQDVFLQSAFGWRKYLEKKDAKGNLTLLPGGQIRLKSSDQKLVRACSTTVPIEYAHIDGEKFVLQYEGRSSFETVKKSSRGGMILINLNYSDGSSERKQLGPGFTANRDWTLYRVPFETKKKVKTVNIWCDLADVTGTFEIRNFRLIRETDKKDSRAAEVFDQNFFGTLNPEVKLRSASGKAVEKNSFRIHFRQKAPAPFIVSVLGKGNCNACFALSFYFNDGSRELYRNGLVFSEDDSDWTMRSCVFYPSKAVKYLIVQCRVPSGEKTFSFRDLKIQNFGVRDKNRPLKTASNLQDRLPVWIWNSTSSSPKQVLCLRYEFTLPSEPVSGILNFAADDLCKIYINGKTALENGSFKCEPVDAAKFLKQGRNCIAAEVKNLVSAAGFLMFGNIILKDGSRYRITTGEDWMTGPEQGQDLSYSKPGYNDIFWGNAIPIMEVTHNHTWRNLIDLSRFLPDKIYENYQKNNERIRKEIPEKLAAIDRILDSEKKIGDISFVRKNGVPFISVPAHKVMLNAPYYNMAGNSPDKQSVFDRISRLNKIGFRVFAYPLRLSTAWKEDGTVDLKDYLAKIRYILAAAPDSYLILGLTLDPPEWFVKKYPQEMIGYDSGRKLTFRGDALKQPMLRPSMASEVWMRLCGEALQKCVSQIEQSPAGKRVVAYMPTYGVYSEWHYYGMEKDMPDTSLPMLRWFKKYLREKYKTDAELQKAWHDTTVTLKTAERPTKEQRLIHKNGQPYLADMDCRVADFDYSIGLAVNHCQEYFNDLARKTAKRNVLVGNYSGYFFGMAYPAFGWHTGTPKIMNTDKMDFQVSPFPYSWRHSGQSGMPRSVWEAYALHNKLAIMEADTRTHQAGPGLIAGKTSKCTEDSIGQINREFCNAFTRGGALWYYDFHWAWFDYPEYFQAFEKLLKIWNDKTSDVTRISEIAVVCDFSSVPYHTAAVNPNYYAANMVSNPTNELNFIGAPHDALLIEDMIVGKAPEYKLYVVLNLVHNTPEKEAAIRKLLAKGAKFLFVYHPEWIGNPPEGVTYAASHKIMRPQLRAIAERAGVHFYCDDMSSMVFACRGFVGIHRKNPGKITLKLRQASKEIRQILPNEKAFPDGNKIEYIHPEYGTTLFQIKPQ